MLRILFRMSVALVAILFACFVADSLLRITEKATEIVVPVVALEALAAEEKAVERESTAASASVARTEPTAASEVPPTVPPPPIASSPPTEPPPLEPPPLERPKVASSAVAPIPDPAAEEKAPTPAAEATETAASAAPMFNTVEAGQLASFGGAASSGNEAEGELGAGRRPVWDVQLLGVETSRQVKLPAGFVLVAVRLKSADVELVPLGGQLPPRPLSHDEFVMLHPAHASRQGIRLAGSALGPWREKLLNYDVQGGWQAWLLIDSPTHSQWLKRLEDEIRRQGRTWDQLAKVSSSVDMRRRSYAGSGSLRIDKLTWKK